LGSIDKEDYVGWIAFIILLLLIQFIINSSNKLLYVYKEGAK